MKAPIFKSISTNKNDFDLKNFSGKYIVLYFYPKDDTPGCTKEACGIRDNYSDFTDNQIVVFGVSYDNASSHRKFKKKFNIPFHLLTDIDKSVSKAYGSDGIFFPSSACEIIVGMNFSKC